MTYLTCARKYMRIMTVLLLVVSLFTMGACTYTQSPEQSSQKLQLSSLELGELEEYIAIGQYKDLDIKTEGRSKGEAVWDEVLSRCEIKAYPNGHVYYYVGQIKEEYGHYAKQADMSYDELIAQLGINEGTILRDAKELTRKDVVCAIVQKLEGITLTEDEKQLYFGEYLSRQ